MFDIFPWKMEQLIKDANSRLFIFYPQTNLSTNDLQLYDEYVIIAPHLNRRDSMSNKK